MVAERAARSRERPRRGEAPAEIGFARFILALQQIEAVRKVAYSVSLHLHLWVLLRTEDPQTEDRIYDLERAYLRGPTAVPFELHVLPLDKIGQDTLPAAETLIER